MNGPASPAITNHAVKTVMNGPASPAITKTARRTKSQAVIRANASSRATYCLNAKIAMSGLASPVTMKSNRTSCSSSPSVIKNMGGEL